MILNNPKTECRLLEGNPGVYRMYAEDGSLLYVGKAKNLQKRVSSYFDKTPAELGTRIALMIARTIRVETVSVPTERDALVLEQRLIQREKPKYNIVFRDDKKYGYIRISDDDFPLIEKTRDKNAPGTVFGPYPPGSEWTAILETTGKAFKLRTCDNNSFANRSRPCLFHQTGDCSAPCVGLIGKSAYLASVAGAKALLSGKSKETVSILLARMEAESSSMEFERAAATRDSIRAITAASGGQEMDSDGGENADILAVVENQNKDGFGAAMMKVRGGSIASFRCSAFNVPVDEEAVSELLFCEYKDGNAPERLVLNTGITREALEFLSLLKCETVERTGDKTSRRVAAWMGLCETNAQEAVDGARSKDSMAAEGLASLARMIGFTPARMDCFDISHNAGEEPVAARVVFLNGRPKKDEYRRLPLPAELGGDDFASMEEALKLAYSNPDTARPDLLIVDGGLGQLSSAVKAAANVGLSCPILAVAKGAARTPGMETLTMSDGREFSMFARNDKALMAIQRIRDEAHRVCIGANRRAIAKKRSDSLLLEVQGIGPAKRRALLAKFGSAKGMLQADESEIAKTPGIGPQLARRILETLAQKFGL